MTKFFNKFPKITYENNLAINLLARVTMSKLALNSKQAYYNYTIVEGTRPDNLSYNYYDNPDYVWLIGLANQIVDPYYDFPISTENLNILITKKYGSVANAQNTIKFFRTNWLADESRITTATYSALNASFNLLSEDNYEIISEDTTNIVAYYTPKTVGASEQKYWAPEINQNNSIIAYVRKKEDWVVTTNKVQNLSYDYSVVDNEFVNVLTEDNYEIMTENDFNIVVDYIPETVTDEKFVAGELVSQGGVTFATVVTVSETTLVIQHVSGTAVTGEITGLTSGASGVVSSLNTISTSIPAEELIYWESVSVYDYEVEQNAKKRNIKLIDNRFADSATKELKNLMLV